jgi:hypothetical protein
MDFYSNNGMHRIFNTFGLASLDRGIAIPDAALGVGYAEMRAPVPLTVSHTPALKQADVPEVKSVYDTYVKTQGNGLQLDSFPHSGYYGDAIGGF